MRRNIAPLKVSIRILFFLLLFFSSLVLKAQENATALNFFKEARRAFEEKDFKSYYSNIEQAYALRPDHPEIIKNLAKACAINDSIDKSIKLLHRIWQMGLTLEIQDDSAYNSLKKDPRYNSIIKRLALNKLPLNRSDTAFIIKEKGLLTEGIAYDPTSRLFYISSVRKGKILIYQNGEFIGHLPGFENEGAVLGLKIDPKRKMLWACTSYLPQFEKFQDSLKGKTAVVKYSLSSKKIIKRYSPTKNEELHSFGDLTLNSRGDVFITDSYGENIYIVPATSGSELKELPVFEKENQPSSMQGITISEDGRHLFVADYLNGIFRIDLKYMTSIRLKLPYNVTTVGSDGMYYHKGALVAIQNGVEPNRVIRFNLNKDRTAIVSQFFMEANHPAFDEPTLGVIIKDYFYYIASSQWSSFEVNGDLKNQEELENHLILKIDLNNRRP